ncbi:MAG TPA: hypothetical protein VG868_07975, partial [Casimicrobiaceae bacterium]|nr:hypothetical protein [Casimicrobiaceae bacterium]
MRARRSLLALATLVLLASSALAQQPQASNASAPARAVGGKQLAPADLKGWKSIRSPVVSNDGRWFAYMLAPNEGDATLVLRQTAEGATEQRFPIGEPPAGVGGPFGPPTAAPLAISGDSKYLAYTVYPTEREARRLRQQRRPVHNKVVVVNLATGQKNEFDKIRRFAFSGDKPQVIALYGYAPEAPSAGGAGGNGGAGNGAAASRTEGADLLLYTLATGGIINIGNVGDFAFDESGSYLAYTIDARDQIGNGVQLRDLRTDVVRPLDSEQALYRRLAWADSGPALAVLRGKADSVLKDTLYSVVSFSGIGTVANKKSVFDVAGRSDFPAGMKVSADRAPRIADDFGAVFFGIREAKPKPASDVMASRDGAAQRPPIVQAGAPGEGGARNQPRVDPDDENPTLVLWHWKDP